MIYSAVDRAGQAYMIFLWGLSVSVILSLVLLDSTYHGKKKAVWFL